MMMPNYRIANDNIISGFFYSNCIAMRHLQLYRYETFAALTFYLFITTCRCSLSILIINILLIELSVHDFAFVNITGYLTLIDTYKIYETEILLQPFIGVIREMVRELFKPISMIVAVYIKDERDYYRILCCPVNGGNHSDPPPVT